MRLTFEALGWTWDWSLMPTGSDDEPDFEPYQDAGTIASTPVAVGDVPWGDVEGLHVYEPAEGDEGMRPRLGFGR